MQDKVGWTYFAGRNIWRTLLTSRLVVEDLSKTEHFCFSFYEISELTRTLKIIKGSVFSTVTIEDDRRQCNKLVHT